MKKIGLLGGMSYESTLTYYRYLNKFVNDKLGGFHSAKIFLNSVDFDEIVHFQKTNNWTQAGSFLAKEAKSLENIGANFILLCTNTMHKVYEDIASVVSIPVLHIADSSAFALKKDGYKKVGLLGTKFTMAQDFYKNRLKNFHDIDVVVPDDISQDEIHRIIFEELCFGAIKDSSKEYFLDIINSLGVDAVLLGCTEIGLLVEQKDTKVTLYDTTMLHIQDAIREAVD